MWIRGPFLRYSLCWLTQHLSSITNPKNIICMFSNNPIFLNNLKNFNVKNKYSWSKIVLSDFMIFELKFWVFIGHSHSYFEHHMYIIWLLFIEKNPCIKFCQKKFEFSSYLSYPSCNRTPEAQSVSNFFLPFFRMVQNDQNFQILSKNHKFLLKHDSN